VPGWDRAVTRQSCKQCGNVSAALGRNDAEFSRVSSQCIDGLGLLRDQHFAVLHKHCLRLLLNRLDWN
jgi:hypothetical protein